MLAGCAAAPEDIQPVPSTRTFAGLTCAELDVEREKIANALAHSYVAERKRRHDDTSIVVLTGIPHSGFQENEVEAEIARLKGEADAFNTELAKRSCNLKPIGYLHNEPKEPLKRKPKPFTGGSPSDYG